MIGGGPAGLAAAIALRQHGLDVAVADALIPPIDKACGEGLMPDSRQALAGLGVELTDGHEFSGIHFASRQSAHEHLVSAPFSSGKGLGVRRLDLHRQLTQRAEETGVRLQWGARVHLGDRRAVTVAGQPWSYRYLVGADGEASAVRRWAGLDAGLLAAKRFGFRRHYRTRPWSSQVEVHWGESGQAYVTPVAEDELCIVAITRHRGLGFDRLLEELPCLKQRLAGCQSLGRDRGAVTATRRLLRVTRGNIALLGDASGSVDAITGEGLALSFRQAALLAAAIERDSLTGYEAAHPALLRRPRMMAAAMLAMDRWAWLRDRMLRALAGDPAIFAGLLDLHLGGQTLAKFAREHGMPLAMHLLRPPLAPNASEGQTAEAETPSSYALPTHPAQDAA